MEATSGMWPLRPPHLSLPLKGGRSWDQAQDRAIARRPLQILRHKNRAGWLPAGSCLFIMSFLIHILWRFQAHSSLLLLLLPGRPVCLASGPWIQAVGAGS